MRRLVEFSDIACIENLRMSRNAFGKLCLILQNQGGLQDSKHVPLSSQVAMFLSILAHHKKNRTVKYDFIRSERTVSKHFHPVLTAVLRLHPLLLANPTLCTKQQLSEVEVGSLGALDGTYIDVVLKQKTELGWEGSAADSRVLRDAITRPTGLKIPRGMNLSQFNGEGFSSPYRGVRYHLKEWESGNNTPQNHQEFFNMKHASTRNVIERTFGLLKARWAILRSPSFYDIDDQNRIIIACCLLHNFIRQEMSVDPLETEMNESISLGDVENTKYIGTVETNQFGIRGGMKLLSQCTMSGVDTHDFYCLLLCCMIELKRICHLWLYVVKTLLLMDDDASKGVRRRGLNGMEIIMPCVVHYGGRSVARYLRKLCTTNTIDVKDDVFDNFAKIDSFAKTLRYKSFPYYAQWCEVFGKDRATAQPTVNRADTERVSSQKRKMVAFDDKFDEKFEAFVNVTDHRLGDIVKRFGMEAEESQACKQVWSVIQSILDLTIEEKHAVSKKLVNNKADLDLFFIMSTAGKETFVKMLASGKV
ncbi:UNVERIFIED_CONTAM: hypothetical protein Scaly_1652800 [Sesamum calycinum]|uniref:DDE Tnp4 domain-containing protein n=1 Tax=Sesamum calycinum TaxID=2727403 RepID=A0AAW2NSX3_9LAMI